MVEFGVAQLLLADPAVKTALKGSVYPLLVPESGSYPAVTYQRVSTAPITTNDGPTGYATVRLQLDCWAADYTQARTLEAAVRKVLDGFRGTLPNGCFVSNAWREDGPTDLYEAPASLFRVMTDYKLLAQE